MSTNKFDRKDDKPAIFDTDMGVSLPSIISGSAASAVKQEPCPGKEELTAKTAGLKMSYLILYP